MSGVALDFGTMEDRDYRRTESAGLSTTLILQSWQSNGLTFGVFMTQYSSLDVKAGQCVVIVCATNWGAGQLVKPTKVDAGGEDECCGCKRTPTFGWTACGAVAFARCECSPTLKGVRTAGKKNVWVGGNAQQTPGGATAGTGKRGWILGVEFAQEYGSEIWW